VGACGPPRAGPGRQCPRLVTTAPEQQTVSFNRMADGTRADYDLLAPLNAEFQAALPDRILQAVDDLNGPTGGFKLTRYEHSLQTATRALRDGRDDEYVTMCLVHDIGDNLAPFTHSEMISAVIKPFVRPEVEWIARHHTFFQTYYYAHLFGDDRNARDRYRDHEWFDACVEFCARYDQESFDPDYAWLSIESFEPMVRAVFSEPRYLTR
jgi:predicted HD phosphohydrolase